MAIHVGQRIVNITNATTVGTTTTGFTVHTFSTPGVTTFTAQGSGLADVLVVGGGGGAGGPGGAPLVASGGAGGGSVLYQKNVPLIDGVSYTATVGSAGVADTNGPTGFGGTSILTYNNGTLTAPGGAFGGFDNTYAGGNNPLGSGGGGARGFLVGGVGANIIGYGFSGSPGPGGAGGGAGGAGSPGQGGIGISFSITGSSVFYGGGGGPNGSSIHPTSSPTNFGLGMGGITATPGNPGCIIIRYQG